MTDRAASARLLDVLEALRMPAHFQQGRRYARTGRVHHLTITGSLASAHVLDEDGHTYRARIATRAFSAAEWHRIERALAGQSIHLAKLLAGRLPDDLDATLAALGLSLVPQGLDELALDCTCESWRVPCRHVTATGYALAESFDRDPFDMLAWRGRTRDELLDRVRALRERPEPVAPPPQPARTATFWSAGPRLAPASPPPAGAALRPDALLDQLDPLPLTLAGVSIVDLLRGGYDAITGG